MLPLLSRGGSRSRSRSRMGIHLALLAFEDKLNIAAEHEGLVLLVRAGVLVVKESSSKICPGADVK